MPNSNYDSAYSSQPNVALVSTIYGDKVSDTVRPNSTDGDVALAVGSMYRPYVKPQPKRRKNDRGHVLCLSDGCKAYPTKTGYCIGHARSLGLVENWNPEGRKTDEPG